MSDPLAHIPVFSVYSAQTHDAHFVITTTSTQQLFQPLTSTFPYKFIFHAAKRSGEEARCPTNWCGAWQWAGRAEMPLPQCHIPWMGLETLCRWGYSPLQGEEKICDESKRNQSSQSAASGKHPHGLDVAGPRGCGSLVGTDPTSWLAREGTEAGAAPDVLQTKGPGSPSSHHTWTPPSKPLLGLQHREMPQRGQFAREHEEIMLATHILNLQLLQ